VGSQPLTAAGHALGVMEPAPAAPAVEDAAVLDVVLLGGFELRLDGAPVPLVPSAERLLALLALHGRPVSRMYVAGTLWPDSAEARSLGNLRSALWRVPAPVREAVRSHGDRLWLAPSVAVDVRAVDAIARRLLEPLPAADRASAADDLRTLLCPDLLPDWYEEWVLAEREHLRDQRLSALEALAATALAEGDLDLARPAAQAVVHAEPLRESAQRLLLRAHLAAGNLADVVRLYRGYRRLLHDELGVAPSPHIDALVSALGVAAP
jgi:DNA-binding SARP family transcriptional activator